MTDKTVLDEVRGTITKVCEFPVSNGDNITSMQQGIIIQPDDETKGTISEAFIGRDYSQFSVGQRVVHVSYAKGDRFEYVTYDELSYDQKMQSAKTK